MPGSEITGNFFNINRIWKFYIQFVYLNCTYIVRVGTLACMQNSVESVIKMFVIYAGYISRGQSHTVVRNSLYTIFHGVRLTHLLIYKLNKCIKISNNSDIIILIY